MLPASGWQWRYRAAVRRQHCRSLRLWCLCRPKLTGGDRAAVRVPADQGHCCYLCPYCAPGAGHVRHIFHRTRFCQQNDARHRRIHHQPADWCRWSRGCSAALMARKQHGSWRSSRFSLVAGRLRLYLVPAWRHSVRYIHAQKTASNCFIITARFFWRLRLFLGVNQGNSRGRYFYITR